MFLLWAMPFAALGIALLVATALQVHRLYPRVSEVHSDQGIQFGSNREIANERVKSKYPVPGAE